MEPKWMRWSAPNWVCGGNPPSAMWQARAHYHGSHGVMCHYNRIRSSQVFRKAHLVLTCWCMNDGCNESKKTLHQCCEKSTPELYITVGYIAVDGKGCCKDSFHLGKSYKDAIFSVMMDRWTCPQPMWWTRSSSNGWSSAELLEASFGCAQPQE